MSPSDESSSSSPAERQWDVAGLFKDNHEKINGLDFDKSGEFLVTSGDDHAVNLYDVNTARLRKVVYSRRYGVQAVRFTHHVPAVICASRHPTNHAVRYMSMHDNSYIRFFEGHTAQVTGLVMSPVNDTFMSASLDQTVRMWDLRIKGCQAFLRSNGRTVVAVDPEGLISAVGCGNGEVKLYDPRHYEQGPFTTFVHKQKQQIDWTSIQINNDGKMIVLTANNNQVVVMDSFKGTVMHTFSAPDPRTLLFDAVFSPSNKEVLAGSSSGNVMSWSLVGGSFRTFPADSSAVEHVAFNPAKEMFASGGSHLAFWLKRRPGDIVKNTAGASETSQKSILLNANLVSNIRPSEFTENASFMNMLPPPPGVAGRTHQQGMAPPNGTPGPATGPPGPQPTGPPSHAGQPVQQHNFQQNGFVPQTGPMQNQQQYMVGQGPQQPGQGRPQGPQQPATTRSAATWTKVDHKVRSNMAKVDHKVRSNLAKVNHKDRSNLAKVDNKVRSMVQFHYKGKVDHKVNHLVKFHYMVRSLVKVRHKASLLDKVRSMGKLRHKVLSMCKVCHKVRSMGKVHHKVRSMCKVRNKDMVRHVVHKAMAHHKALVHNPVADHLPDMGHHMMSSSFSVRISA
eukprot:48447_1